MIPIINLAGFSNKFYGCMEWDNPIKVNIVIIRKLIRLLKGMIV